MSAVCSDSFWCIFSYQQAVGKEAGNESSQGQAKETGYGSGHVPSNTGEKVGAQLTKDQDARDAKQADAESKEE